MYVTVTVVFVQSDVAINTFCQDLLPVIIGFVLLNTNVLMRIFLRIFLALEYTIFSLPEAVPDPEICQKHVCGRDSAPDLAVGAHARRSPRPPSRLGGGYPFPRTLPSRRLRRLDTRRLDVCPLLQKILAAPMPTSR